MYYVLWWFDNWYAIACGDPMNGMFFDNFFLQSICGYDYYLHHPFTLKELYITALFYAIYLLY